MKRYAKTEAKPSTMPYTALLCAVNACEGSEHASDRRFARKCLIELHDRLDELPALRSRVKRRNAAMKQRTIPAHDACALGVQRDAISVALFGAGS